MNSPKYALILFFVLITHFPITVWSGGRLTVTTDPQGVEVWLGENFIGNSPVTERLIEPGRHTVKLIDPIHRTSHQEQVLIIDGQTVTVDKKMTRRYGALNIFTYPSNAEVYLTVPLGRSPLTNEFIIPGQYLLEIRHPEKNYKELQKSVVVRQGSVVQIRDTLQSAAPDFRERFLNVKTLTRIGLGAGASAGLIWAVIENGSNQIYLNQLDKNKAKRARIHRNIGVIGGLLCVVGFQVVAFF